MAGNASGQLVPRGLACLGLVVLSGCSGHGSARAVHAQVSARFVPQAFASISRQEFWLLGTAPCGSGRCSAVMRTRDGGRSFTRTGAPPLPTEGFVPTLSFATRRDGFAFLPGPRGALFATHDDGASWHRVALGDPLAFATGGGNAYAVTARCSSNGCTGYRLRRFRASTTTWSSNALPFTPDGSVVELAARGSSVWLLGTPSGGERNAHDVLARSTDGGRTFRTGSGPCYPGLGGELAPASTNVVWAVCPTGMLAGAWRSTDGGITFGRLNTSPLANSATLAPSSSGAAVLTGNAAGSRLMRTTDGGAGWRPARTPRRATDVMWVGFTDSHVGAAIVQTGWDAAAKAERHALWRTTNGGASWSLLRVR